MAIEAFCYRKKRTFYETKSFFAKERIRKCIIKLKIYVFSSTVPSRRIFSALSLFPFACLAAKIIKKAFGVYMRTAGDGGKREKLFKWFFKFIHTRVWLVHLLSLRGFLFSFAFKRNEKSLQIRNSRKLITCE